MLFNLDLQRKSDGSLVFDFLYQCRNFFDDVVFGKGKSGFLVRFLPGMGELISNAWEENREEFEPHISHVETDILTNLRNTYPKLQSVGLSGQQLRAKLGLLNALSERIRDILDRVKRGAGKVGRVLDRVIDKVFDVINSLFGSLIAASTGGIVDPLEATKEIKELIHHAIDAVFPKPT